MLDLVAELDDREAPSQSGSGISEEDVAKYRGKYKTVGWDQLREERFARQQKLGVLPANATLSPRDPDLPSWDSIAPKDRDWWDLRMATYAAMIDRMDRNIGRILEKLEATLSTTSMQWQKTRGARGRCSV